MQLQIVHVHVGLFGIYINAKNKKKIPFAICATEYWDADLVPLLRDFESLNVAYTK